MFSLLPVIVKKATAVPSLFDLSLAVYTLIPSEASELKMEDKTPG